MPVDCKCTVQKCCNSHCNPKQICNIFKDLILQYQNRCILYLDLHKNKSLSDSSCNKQVYEDFFTYKKNIY